MTDAVIFPFKSPFSMMCNSDGKGEKGEGMMHCVTQLVADLVLFQLPLCGVLLTTVWVAVFGLLPPYLRNDHVPVKGPCESHYP